MSQESRLNNSLLFLFFFSSGFAALLYQIVWLKYLNLLFGSTTYATAAVLSAFMFGLSLGSRLSARIPFLFRSALRSYGLVEMGVGLFALLFPYLYSGSKIPFAVIFNIVGPETLVYNACTFLIASLVLAIPTSLMGASLPLLSHYVIRDKKVAATSGLLYGINTAGAVAGILCVAFILIPFLGLHATIYVGVLVNLVVGLICFLAGKESSPLPTVEPSTKPAEPLLLLYAISGLLALGYEVLWTRILVLHIGSSVYAYAIMLAVFLLGISAGSYFAGRWIENREVNLNRLFSVIQMFWAFSVLLQIVQFAYFSDVLYFLSIPFYKLNATIQFLIFFIGVFQLLFLPTFLSGALFPLLVARLSKQGARIKDAISFTYSYNTIGGIFGSIFAAFVLIPAFGTQKALFILAALNMTLAFCAIYLSGERKKPALLVALACLFVATVAVEQRKIQMLRSAGIFRMEGKEQLLHLEEDASATISVETRLDANHPYRSLSVNGVNVAGTSPDLIAVQKLQGHIPLILFGPDKQKSVLHIGFGSGGTAYSVSLYPNTEITVVELSHGVVRNADNYFGEVNHGVVHSGKLNFIYFDGRSFLQNTRSNFDVILSDSIHPRYSGNGSLYTREYYQLVNARLNPGGVHSQWIPLYSLTLKNLKEILRAFTDIFPQTYIWYINSTINPYIIVTGKKDSSEISTSSLASAWKIPGVRNDLISIAVKDPYFLIDYFAFGGKQLAYFVQDVDPHLDDLLTVEYESSRVRNRDLSWWINFRDIVQHREPAGPYFINDANFDPALFGRFYEATTANLQGQLYLLAGKTQEAFRFFSEARNKNKLDPDPSFFIPTSK